MIKILKTIPVRFFTEASGREPVRIWLKSLAKEERRIIGEDIKAVQLRWPLGMPLVRPLGNGLWEIRSNLCDIISRLIFIFSDGFIVLLHGFIKKSQETPKRDLKLAKERAKKVMG